MTTRWARRADEARGRLRALAPHAPWLLPSLVAVIAIVPVVWALYSQSFAVLGRDQGIFQYVAWALRNGDHAYRDIHEINGPLPHAWYILMQLLGGEDEHVFRTIDTLLLVTVYVLAASTLPRWVGLGGESRVTRVAWALGGLAVFGAQYSRYDWWHTAQRESLYALMVMGSLALQSVVHTTRTRRTALSALACAGLLTSLPWFGKPPCVVFALLQAVVLWIDRRSLAVSFRTALVAAGAGMLVTATAMIGFAAAYGDIARGIVLLSKVPRLHNTIWHETFFGVYRAYNNAPRLDWAIVMVLGFLAAVFLFKLPRRALLTLVLPIGGFVVFAGQGKAFPYHLHMLTLGTATCELVIVASAAKSLEAVASQTEKRPRLWLEFVATVSLLAAVGLGSISAQDAWLSPGVRGKWASIGGSAEKRATRAYLDHFPWGDFSPIELRDAAAYLSFHTLSDERVQTYGFDPYLLFLARRKSASPVIYNFELNVDAALRGGPGARPDAELKRWLMDYRDETELLVLHTLEASPPAAFALIDRAPFSYPEDAERDLEEHSPRLFQWMTAHYERSAVFGAVRIWLRRDVKERNASR
jgi:hypothetical protein